MDPVTFQREQRRNLKRAKLELEVSDSCRLRVHKSKFAKDTLWIRKASRQDSRGFEVEVEILLRDKNKNILFCTGANETEICVATALTLVDQPLQVHEIVLVYTGTRGSHAYSADGSFETYSEVYIFEAQRGFENKPWVVFLRNIDHPESFDSELVKLLQKHRALAWERVCNSLGWRYQAEDIAQGEIRGTIVDVQSVDNSDPRAGCEIKVDLGKELIWDLSLRPRNNDLWTYDNGIVGDKPRGIVHSVGLFLPPGTKACSVAA